MVMHSLVIANMQQLIMEGAIKSGIAFTRTQINGWITGNNERNVSTNNGKCTHDVGLPRNLGHSLMTALAFVKGSTHKATFVRIWNTMFESVAEFQSTQLTQ